MLACSGEHHASLSECSLLLIVCFPSQSSSSTTISSPLVQKGPCSGARSSPVRQYCSCSTDISSFSTPSTPYRCQWCRYQSRYDMSDDFSLLSRADRRISLRRGTLTVLEPEDVDVDVHSSLIHVVSCTAVVKSTKVLSVMQYLPWAGQCSYFKVEL